MPNATLARLNTANENHASSILFIIVFLSLDWTFIWFRIFLDLTFNTLQQIWLFSRVKTLQKSIKKPWKKIILRVQLTLDNLRNIYRQKENFEGLRGPQNKCSNIILRVKKPLNNILPRFKRFIFTILDK